MGMLAIDSLEGSAQPAIEGDNLDVLPVKTPPKVSVPVMEKGDEPLSQHKEEVVQDTLEKVTSSHEGGLSLVQKLGAVGVIVALCALFLRGRSPKRSVAGRSGAYEKSMA